MEKYDIALFIKGGTDGLNKKEVVTLMDLVKGEEVYPLEISGYNGNSTAMGFISSEAAETLNYDYDASGLKDFIANALEYPDDENSSSAYKFNNLKIFMDYGEL